MLACSLGGSVGSGRLRGSDGPDRACLACSAGWGLPCDCVCLECVCVGRSPLKDRLPDISLEPIICPYHARNEAWWQVHSKRTSLVLELVTRGFLVTSKTSKRSTTRLVCVRYFLLRLYLHTKKTLTQCECRAVQIGSVGTGWWKGGMSCQWIPPICTALYSHEVKII